MGNNFQDKIDEYILGRMSDEEKAQFEAEVSQDKSKNEQLLFTQNVKKAISSREEKLARIKIMQHTYDQKRRKKSFTRIWWWTSGIAAVFVIGFIVVKPTVDILYPVDFSPSEMIRGDEGVFEIEIEMKKNGSAVDRSIVIDTIPCDTVIDVKEMIDKLNE